jgi:AcrR family transcriptional regulator
MSAVRELLAERKFHSATVEEVADRAGIARATLYQHFRSRLELVDAMCDSFDANPALLAIRESVAVADPEAALEQTIANTVGFWSSEDAVLSQLYGVAAVDEAARDLVDRQRRDRRGEMSRLAAQLHGAGALPSGTSEDEALTLLMVLTSYETYRELREAGHDAEAATKQLLASARTLLIGHRAHLGTALESST